VRWVLLLLCLLGPSQAWAAIAHDASSNSGVGTFVTSLSWSHTCTACDLIVVKTHARDETLTQLVVTGVTYNSVALTKAREDIRDGVSWEVGSGVWYLKAPATGANTVQVSFTGNTEMAAASATTLSGVDQTTPLDASNGATGLSAAPSVNVTTVADNAWVIDSVTMDNEPPFSAVGAGQVSRENRDCSTVNGGAACGSSTEGPKTPAGSVTMSWTAGSSNDWAIAAASFAPSGGGGGGGGLHTLPTTGAGA
jgi:hypothetical protein